MAEAAQPLLTVQDVIAQRDSLRATVDAALHQQAEAYRAFQETIDECNKFVLLRISELSPGALLELHFKLTAQQDVLSAKNKTTMEPVNAELEAVTTALKKYMLENQMDQVKTAGVGMTFFTAKDSVTVKDMNSVIGFVLQSAPPPQGMPDDQWAAILEHVKSHGMWGLLKKDVTKTAVKDLLKDGTPVPGVELRQYNDLSFRKA